ncbi:hypothetical protein PWG14_17870 (plasmid) [Chromobacterium amazonense]|uniref:hypothetical protein n=1 Tax=Chromobacterium amazonense TaxID=1382803 RepID=UPI00237E6077|nr:hypothetical protein [Chromobacterium amazonense]MDE1714383.1 hypothetical protein [Chromobacterium amazonense]
MNRAYLESIVPVRKDGGIPCYIRLADVPETYRANFLSESQCATDWDIDGEVTPCANLFDWQAWLNNHFKPGYHRLRSMHKVG